MSTNTTAPKIGAEVTGLERHELIISTNSCLKEEVAKRAKMFDISESCWQFPGPRFDTD